MQAMPDGGTLGVRTAHGPSVVIVEISDSGIGILDDMMLRIFEPFFTNKPNGTGLSISAHIVTQHGGQIDIDRSPLGGTIFRVGLPRLVPATGEP